MSIYDKSGVGIPDLPSGSALAKNAGLLGSVGAMVSGVAPLLGIAGGVGGMFDGESNGTHLTRAVSGGTFTTGEFGTGKPGSTLIIITVVALGLFFLFKRSK